MASESGEIQIKLEKVAHMHVLEHTSEKLLPKFQPRNPRSALGTCSVASLTVTTVAIVISYLGHGTAASNARSAKI